MAGASIRPWNQKQFADAAAELGFRLTSIYMNAENIHVVAEVADLVPTAEGNYFASFFELSRNPVEAVGELVKKLEITRASLG